MKKQYCIFWIGSQREVYGDDSYHVLGTIWGTYNTLEDAEKAIEEIGIENMMTIIPIYRTLKS